MKKTYNIMVVGPGRWGSFLTWYLDRIGNKVTLYGHNEAIFEMNPIFLDQQPLYYKSFSYITSF